MIVVQAAESYPDLSLVEAIKFYREGADVQRCHTIRTIGEYSVGHHSFNILAMLRLLKPNADVPIEVIYAIIDHDIPERLTGDIPAPTKWSGLVDRGALNLFEDLLISKIAGKSYEHSVLPTLDDGKWLPWIRGLDILELYLFTLDQIAMGNKIVDKMRIRIDQYIISAKSKYPEEVLDLYFKIKNSNWDHMPDLGDHDGGQ